MSLDSWVNLLELHFLSWQVENKELELMRLRQLTRLPRGMRLNTGHVAGSNHVGFLPLSFLIREISELSMM